MHSLPNTTASTTSTTLYLTWVICISVCGPEDSAVSARSTIQSWSTTIRKSVRFLVCLGYLSFSCVLHVVNPVGCMLGSFVCPLVVPEFLWTCHDWYQQYQHSHHSCVFFFAGCGSYYVRPVNCCVKVSFWAVLTGCSVLLCGVVCVEVVMDIDASIRVTGLSPSVWVTSSPYLTCF